MSNSISTLPRGRVFVRALIAKSLVSANDETLTNFAATRWGAYSGEHVVKAVVGAITSGEIGTDAREFFDLVFERSILGRLSGLRRVPFHIRMLRVTNGANGFWVGESQPKPLSKTSIMGATLRPAKVAAIIVLTKEALSDGGALVESALQRDMERAIVDTLDLAFIDQTNDGVANERPASITYGAPTVAATDDPSADLLALIAAFGGDLASAFFVTDPTTATALATVRDAAGSFMFTDIGPRGGSLLGIPVIVSRASPVDSGGGQIALIDPTGIAYGSDGISIEKSEHASLQMTDEPGGGGSEMVSLWQTNSVASKSEIFTNWEVQRDGSVVVLTGVDYGSAP